MAAGMITNFHYISSTSVSMPSYALSPFSSCHARHIALLVYLPLQSLASIPEETVKTPAQLTSVSNRTKIHQSTSKATSSLITQIRTEKIGLDAFLADPPRT